MITDHIVTLKQITMITDNILSCLCTIDVVLIPCSGIVTISLTILPAALQVSNPYIVNLWRITLTTLGLSASLSKPTDVSNTFPPGQNILDVAAGSSYIAFTSQMPTNWPSADTFKASFKMVRGARNLPLEKRLEVHHSVPS